MIQLNEEMLGKFFKKYKKDDIHANGNGYGEHKRNKSMFIKKDNTSSLTARIGKKVNGKDKQTEQQ
eukprot:CAMPEP_0116976712 /NCGR_PEP_ID=MMETSP0467-20121206/56678_1 /TAXON_ID=283647 /ORGANISM="Mesodinium pulex, Strain SPMC105" /LENGTH=65 /DNA_ID=CAMNT_0004669601 /DNA_START=235 /DNA_END=432 /DNA_ORIENTATION=+